MNDSSAFLFLIVIYFLRSLLNHFISMYLMRLIFMKFLISALIFFNSIIYCQTNDSASDQGFPSLNDDIKSFFNTGEKIFSSPAKFDKNDWITFASILALTGTSTLLDEDTRSFWKRKNSVSFNSISEAGRIYGEISYAGIFSGTLYLSGKISKNKDLAITGRMLLEGLFYAGITTSLIKFATGRSRPYTNDGHLSFKFFQTCNDFTSFPSGHSTVAFTLSSILSDRIDNTYASVALYTLALSTIWQRMYSDNHWLSDTIMGAAIGYLIGKAVVKFDDSNSAENPDVNPAAANSQYYELFRLTYSF